MNKKALPSSPAILSPTQMQRLTNVAMGHLAPLGIEAEIQVREDGRFAVIMPPVWFHWFLASLVAQVEGLQGQLRKAGWDAYRKSAALQAHLAEAAADWERQKARLRQRYWELVYTDGLSSREAIRTIKRESHGELSASVIAGVCERRKPKHLHLKKGRRRKG